jgi:hypothetical protein
VPKPTSRLAVRTEAEWREFYQSVRATFALPELERPISAAIAAAQAVIDAEESGAITGERVLEVQTAWRDRVEDLGRAVMAHPGARKTMRAFGGVGLVAFLRATIMRWAFGDRGEEEKGSAYFRAIAPREMYEFPPSFVELRAALGQSNPPTRPPGVLSDEIPAELRAAWNRQQFEARLYPHCKPIIDEYGYFTVKDLANRWGLKTEKTVERLFKHFGVDPRELRTRWRRK